MASAGYHIVDEPRPGPIHRAVVRPLWPLFAMMLGGAWLAWPWFLFNAWAMKSPRLARNAVWVVAGLAGGVALAGGALVLLEERVIAEAALPYAVIVLLVWKLLVSYALTLDQERSFELHRYFGGKVANGMWVMLIGSFYVDSLVTRAIGGIPSVEWRGILLWVLA